MRMTLTHDDDYYGYNNGNVDNGSGKIVGSMGLELDM
jgi:hypothetical protein